MGSPEERILVHLIALYGETQGRATFERLAPALASRPAEGGRDLSERDSILITYGDQVREPGRPPLRTLAEFCDRHVRGLVSGVHLLPFYPYSSDDGFSVMDYRAVDPSLGTWEDVERLGRGFRLMFDAVVNHVSARSEWFQAFLREDPAYRDFFIVVPEGSDLSAVVRPRALPLLTRFSTAAGDKWVWTTFSEDQVDLNYHNPEVLLEIVRTLRFYVSHGAEFIRLDAIAYLWKEIGTTCIHLPGAHRVIRLFRAVLDAVAPDAMLITETNVPHAENVAYFGDGYDEAQMVYNFALPPLVLHAFHTGDARALSKWAASLSLPSDRVTFFNFLASHDGIGVTPARGILSEAEIAALVDRAIAHGGRVSYRQEPGGGQSPYELNINYLDALSDPRGGEALDRQADRFLAAHAVMLSLVGVPGIYFHSLFGSRGWPEGAALTGRHRTINRQKFERAPLEAELADPASLRRRVFGGFSRLLRARAGSAAFHPHGGQTVIECGGSAFGLLRHSPDGRERVLCLIEVSGREHDAGLGLERFGELGLSGEWLTDLISGERISPREVTSWRLRPYQVVWLGQTMARGGEPQI